MSGPSAHVRGVIKGFQMNGWQVCTYVVGDMLSPSSSKVTDRITKSRLKLLFNDLIRIWMNIINQEICYRKFLHVDWVYERYGAFQSLGTKLHRRGIPWILEVNGLFFSESLNDRKSIFLSRLEYQSMRRACLECDAIVTVSDGLARALCREFGVAREKILVVPNAVDTDIFDPSQTQPIREFTDPTIGFVGSFMPWHGIDLLLEAASRLKSRGCDIRYTLVGDGVMFERCKQLCTELRLTDVVRFVGNVAPRIVPSYIAGFDICFGMQYPRKDGILASSSLKIFEYAAMAKPVILSQVEADQIGFADGISCFVVNGTSLEELIQTFELAYYNRARWAEMGRKARELIVSRHTWSVRVKEMAEGLKAILDRNVKIGSQ